MVSILDCNCICHSPSTLVPILQAITALVSLFLAGYIFTYQRGKDKRNDHTTALLNEQNIKLQWFKELIVQPNKMVIDSFYSNLVTIKNKINSGDLTIEQKEDINNFVKAELAQLRKSFIDVLQQIDKNFATQILENIDSLVDGITEAIFNDELKLCNHAVYDKFIGSKIAYSKNNLIAQLYNYKGINQDNTIVK